MSAQQEMLSAGGFLEEDDKRRDSQRAELDMAEMELALDPDLVAQLDAIDAAFATEAGRNFEMMQGPIERKKDGYTQGGWARG